MPGTPRKPAGVTLDSSTAAPGPNVRIEPSADQVVEVFFESTEAYYVWCDRFAFRVTFRIDNERVKAVAETVVMRVTPLVHP